MNTGPRGPRGPRGPTALFAVLASGLVALPLYSQAPVPRTDSTGKAISFDFPGLKIGVAEYDEGPTGTTVFYFPRGVKAAADVRGGAPGTLNCDAVRLGYESAMMQAVVFSGGSWYGTVSGRWADIQPDRDARRWTVMCAHLASKSRSMERSRAI